MPTTQGFEPYLAQLHGARGGVNVCGKMHRIDLVLANDVSDTDLARAKATHSVTELGIGLLLGPYSSGFTDEVAEELGFGPEEKPVVVIEVDSLSQAAEKGIQVRDIITEINQERITSTQHFMRSISTLEKGRSALFWLWRPDRGVDVRALRMTN